MMKLQNDMTNAVQEGPRSPLSKSIWASLLTSGFDVQPESSKTNSDYETPAWAGLLAENRAKSHFLSCGPKDRSQEFFEMKEVSDRSCHWVMFMNIHSAAGAWVNACALQQFCTGSMCSKRHERETPVSFPWLPVSCRCESHVCDWLLGSQRHNHCLQHTKEISRN